MRGSGLRSRLFRAIGVVVLICVSLTIGLGVVLTHRAVKHATLRDLAHQVDLLAEAQRNAPSAKAELEKLLPSFHRQHEKAFYNRERILPAWAQHRLNGKRPQPAQGTVNYKGAAYYFAAQNVNPGTLIVLR